MSGARRRPLGFAAAILLVLLPASARAQSIVLEDGAEEAEAAQIYLPYAFYTELNGFFFGAGGVSSGYLQPQLTFAATGYGSTNETVRFVAIVRGLRVPWTERLFLRADLDLAHLGRTFAYRDGNPDFPDERAGSNGSSKENFLDSAGDRSRFEWRADLVLPLGDGRHRPLPTFHLERGLLAGGAMGGGWPNPFARGRTFLQGSAFYRSLELEEPGDAPAREATNGVRLGVRYENVDFPTNPSTGNTWEVVVSRDPGTIDSTNTWTTIEGSISQYASLGESDWFRQRVVALHGWTADTPTWDVGPEGEPQGRPPHYEGAVLGSFFRMRGFRDHRFQDRAAIYYSAELRLMPVWNPLEHLQVFADQFTFPWWQVVPYVEVGQVAPTWTVRALHDDPRVDGGVDLRFMVNRVVVRMGLSVSREGPLGQLIVSHPFD